MLKQSKIRELKGVGEKTEQLFGKLGLKTIEDLVHYYPRSYDVYEAPVPIASLQTGKTSTIRGKVASRPVLAGSSRMQIVQTVLKDETDSISVVWYRMPFLRSTMKLGDELILRGKVVSKKGKKTLEHPEIYNPCEKYNDKLDTLQPVYGLTAGLSNNVVSKSVKAALDSIDLSKDPLPDELRMKYHLAEFNFAVRGVHFPEDKGVFFHARDRIVFDEFLSFILSLRKLRDENVQLINEYPIKDFSESEKLIRNLPYSLTGAQEKVWNSIKENLSGKYAMSRLIQGDVGSGKTILAILSLLTMAANGYQSCLMAPTEVLAKQHYESITRLFEQNGIRIKVVLLTGSMTAKEKRRAYDSIECGYAKIIIGTHAIFQAKVFYDNLALVITDEQHRFGVKQREQLSHKGTCPHVMVMSATPIPRSLALIIYGDLDISVIDELPANRLPIKNCVVDQGYRPTAYRFMKKQISEGRQCYVICSMVEESENAEAENVLDYSANLQEEMGDEIVVHPLHGKMKQAEKDSIMEAFARNEIQILVSTTVIEVGIDVANATTILIEDADRFGLAQLHQLRGRVGRGKHQSYCIFMTNSGSDDTKKRLNILNHSNDGFVIASEDLKLRGPGDLFGIRQSGLLDFQLADVYQDSKILQMANEAADYMISQKFDLSAYIKKAADGDLTL